MEHFHSEDKGCKLVKCEQYIKDDSNKKISYALEKHKNGIKESPIIEGKFCLVHGIAICRCGWEWDHHIKPIEHPEKNIKKRCSNCNCPIWKSKRTLGRYLKKGNWCDTCIVRLERYMLPDTNKQHLSREIVDKLLTKRRIKYNYIQK